MFEIIIIIVFSILFGLFFLEYRKNNKDDSISDFASLIRAKNILIEQLERENEKLKADKDMLGNGLVKALADGMADLTNTELVYLLTVITKDKHKNMDCLDGKYGFVDDDYHERLMTGKANLDAIFDKINNALNVKGGE